MVFVILEFKTGIHVFWNSKQFENPICKTLKDYVSKAKMFTIYETLISGWVFELFLWLNWDVFEAHLKSAKNGAFSWPLPTVISAATKTPFLSKGISQENNVKFDLRFNEIWEKIFPAE